MAARHELGAHLPVGLAVENLLHGLPAQVPQGLFSRKQVQEASPLDDVECPGWWLPAGFAVLTPVVVTLQTPSP